MIPLQTTLPVKNFPRLTSALCLSLLGLDLVSRFWPGPRTEFLGSISFVPMQLTQVFSGHGVPLEGVLFRGLASSFFFNNFFSLLVHILFVWVFTPKLFERRGGLFAALCALLSLGLSLGTFVLIHPHSSAPMLIPEAIVGSWLGAYMRRDIWGTVNTLVIGPGWVRVLEVPSYVQLFFWFFYQLISNLFLETPFSDAPMLYWIGFIAFLWGFIFDSIWGALFANRTTAA